MHGVAPQPGNPMTWGNAEVSRRWGLILAGYRDGEAVFAALLLAGAPLASNDMPPAANQVIQDGCAPPGKKVAGRKVRLVIVGLHPPSGVLQMIGNEVQRGSVVTHVAA